MTYHTTDKNKTQWDIVEKYQAYVLHKKFVITKAAADFILLK